MAKKKKPGHQPVKCCETCANMLPIGEGDHICEECEGSDGTPAALILDNYNPAEDYFICGGRCWAPQ